MMRPNNVQEMNPAQELAPENLPAFRSRTALIGGKVLLHGAFLCIAVAAFTAHEHFKVHGQSTASLASLLAAAGFGLAPLRALAGGLFAVERKIMHLVHGLVGLGLVALAFGGVVKGGPLLSHAALAPFAIMGAAQAVMHQDHPRTPEQAEALRRFATSLPEVEQFTKSDNLTSPANVQRAVRVLTDLITKAQALGETELRSDPGFQSALKQATTRFGLTLGLDAAENGIGRLSTNPAAAGALPGLREQLAAARKTVEGK